MFGKIKKLKVGKYRRPIWATIFFSQKDSIYYDFLELKITGKEIKL